ncbi:hypothetical protein ACRAWD_06500 [Caulobacter segnis]
MLVRRCGDPWCASPRAREIELFAPVPHPLRLQPPIPLDLLRGECMECSAAASSSGTA